MSTRFKRLLVTLRLFIQNELWNNEDTGIWMRRFNSLMRILIISYQRFVAIQFSTQAAALTYFSLVSIVPVFAVAFAIAKGFNLQERLYRQLMINFESQQYIVTQIIEFTDKILDTVSGGLLAGVSLLFILWSLIRVMSTIEGVFNQVWDIKTERTWIRKFTDYMAIAFITPIFLIVAGSVNVYLASAVKDALAMVGADQQLSFFVDVTSFLLPYIMIWLAFSFFFMAMPNTIIPFKSAFFAAVVSGTLFQLTQVAYIYFQIGVSKSNAVYGSFAALPLFFVWMQLSWRIILLGVVISYAHRNNHVRQVSFNPKQSLKSQLASTLEVWKWISEDFQDDKSVLTVDELFIKSGLSLNDVNSAIERLRKADLIHEALFGSDEKIGYLPNFNPNLLSEKQLRERIMTAKV